MGYETLNLEKKEDGIAILMLNRPDKLNAINQKMAEELLKVITEVRQDDSVKTLILSGAGRGFCSGTDIDNLMALTTSDAYGEFGSTRQDLRGPTPRWVIPLATLEKPTIAALNGVAAGAGFSMTMACDIRIASENARFAPVWVKRGLIPEAGSTYFLPRVIGKSRAYELVFTGDIIDAKEAERIGLVSRVVPAQDLMRVATELASKIAKGPPIAIELAKQAISKAAESDLVSAIYNENHAQSICHMTEDHKEGIKAFLEKRAPLFKGK